MLLFSCRQERYSPCAPQPMRPLERAAFLFSRQFKVVMLRFIPQVCRRLKPDWQKACYRMAVARLALGRYEDAALAAWEVSQGEHLFPSKEGGEPREFVPFPGCRIEPQQTVAAFPTGR